MPVSIARGLPLRIAGCKFRHFLAARVVNLSQRADFERRLPRDCRAAGLMTGLSRDRVVGREGHVLG